jgi:hypothetical protein
VGQRFNSHGFSSSRPSFGERERFRQGEYIAHISDFVKQIRGSSIDSC